LFVICSFTISKNFLEVHIGKFNRKGTMAMSFDLGIWYSEAPMTADEAGAYFEHINSDWVVVRRAAEIDAFLRDLLERFPDGWYPKPPPDSPDDPPIALLQSAAELRATAAAVAANGVPPAWPSEEPEDMPWATSPIAAQGSTVTLSISFSAVQRTAPVVHELAMRHGLVFYDPQSHHVALPRSLADKTTPALPPRRLMLRISGKPPNLGSTLLLDGVALGAGVVASRREAHAEARQLALSHRLDHYQVEDPGSLAQSLRWEPVSNNDLGLPGTVMPGVVVSQLKIVEPDE
jgi:hypothetical protein